MVIELIVIEIYEIAESGNTVAGREGQNQGRAFWLVGLHDARDNAYSVIRS